MTIAAPWYVDASKGCCAIFEPDPHHGPQLRRELARQHGLTPQQLFGWRDRYLILSQSSNDSFSSAMHILRRGQRVKQRLIAAVAALRDAIFVTMSHASIGSECGSWSKHWDYTKTVVRALFRQRRTFRV